VIGARPVAIPCKADGSCTTSNMVTRHGGVSAPNTCGSFRGGTSAGVWTRTALSNLGTLSGGVSAVSTTCGALDGGRAAPGDMAHLNTLRFRSSSSGSRPLSPLPATIGLPGRWDIHPYYAQGGVRE
jgi:hypothetical protein